MLKDIFNVVGAFIASVGGATAVLFGLSSWFGKMWADKILQKQKHKHQKDIENYKSQLELQINRANYLNEKAVYITKKQYDKEFEIYMEIWERMNNCVIQALKFFPILEEIPISKEQKKEFDQKKWTNYIEAYNKFYLSLSKFEPFFEEKFYTQFDSIRKDTLYIEAVFKTYYIDPFRVQGSQAFRYEKLSRDENRQVQKEIPEKIKSVKKNLSKDINQYLKSLRIVD